MKRSDFRRVIFPPRCPSCDEVLAPDERTFCADCMKLVHRVSGNYCVRCGRQLTKELEVMCDDCSRKTHMFSEGRSLYVYDGPMREAMYRFKYAGRRSYADSFARDAADLWGDWIQGMDFDMIVPVPMYSGKRKTRGFDQAEVFARALGEETGIPCLHLLDRVMATPPMKGLSPEERRKNLKNAFQVRDFDVKSKRVLLCDDIYTTGSTMDAAAERLLEAGVSDVCGMFICTGE